MLLHGYEFIARERQKALLQEAEHLRLLKSLEPQQINRPNYFWQVAGWLGVRLERWGQNLQYHGVNTTAQLKAVGIPERKYRSCR
jgi:hypothetical protein